MRRGGTLRGRDRGRARLSDTEAPDALAEQAAAHLRALGREPRPAGGAGEQRAREHCAAALRDCGFRVHDEPFEYSALPGRWATPAAGALMAASLAAAGHLGYRVQRPGLALLLLLLVGVVIAVGGWWMGTRGVLRLPLLRERGANLVAERGEPRVWLVAHLDSKSQPVPMALRVGGIVLGAALWAAAVGVAAAQLRGLAVADLWPWVSAAGVIASVPVMASTVGARSPGALDNASGMATVLLAARAVPRDVALGVLITSAEELGLAGARAWVRGRAPAIALNVDGVDDASALTCMYSGAAPDELLRAVRAAATVERVTVRRLLPGILVDGVALADAGWAVITVSRGTVGTLARIHTPADTVDRLTGSGVASAAALLVRIARAVA